MFIFGSIFEFCVVVHLKSVETAKQMNDKNQTKRLEIKENMTQNKLNQGYECVTPDQYSLV